ncbi:MAG: hypothetical protein KKD44_00780 [Proteobacteria bacterium]|nr:hypothetical protein [Pseudomonadota bacterium]
MSNRSVLDESYRLLTHNESQKQFFHGGRLLITDITVNHGANSETLGDERSTFTLEGPDFATKVQFNVVYPTAVHNSYINGIPFEAGEDVYVLMFLFPYSSSPIRYYNVTLTGKLVTTVL